MEKINFFENDEEFLNSLNVLANKFSGAKNIAVKLHMGEPGNKNYIKADFTKKVIVKLLEMGFKPFIFDSPVVYSSPRRTEEGYVKAVAEHGYTKENVGCEIIVSNESTEFKGKDLTYGVCKKLLDADAVLVLTHVKGHFCCGFGGAIKNLGMGALSRETKGAIHSGGKPVYENGCTFCGECEKACPTKNIRYDDKGPKFDKTFCTGCSNCVYVCKFNALKTKVDSFDYLLAEGASFAAKNFKKRFYVSVVRNISKNCDCNADAGPIVSEDIGILTGDYPATIDKAAFDLINKKAGKDLFLEVNKKTPLMHIEEASKLGLGDLTYEVS